MSCRRVPAASHGDLKEKVHQGEYATRVSLEEKYVIIQCRSIQTTPANVPTKL